MQDIKVAALTVSLPESFTSVTSPFEQKQEVSF